VVHLPKTNKKVRKPYNAADARLSYFPQIFGEGVARLYGGWTLAVSDEVRVPTCRVHKAVRLMLRFFSSFQFNFWLQAPFWGRNVPRVQR